MLFSDKPTITFSEIIKFLEEIVADQTAKTEVTCVYNVFDKEQKGHVSVGEINEALHRLYGKKITEDEVQGILSFADQDNNGCVKEQGTCATGLSAILPMLCSIICCNIQELYT